MKFSVLITFKSKWTLLNFCITATGNYCCTVIFDHINSLFIYPSKLLNDGQLRSHCLVHFTASYNNPFKSCIDFSSNHLQHLFRSCINFSIKNFQHFVLTLWNLILISLSFLIFLFRFERKKSIFHFNDCRIHFSSYFFKEFLSWNKSA